MRCGGALAPHLESCWRVNLNQTKWVFLFPLTQLTVYEFLAIKQDVSRGEDSPLMSGSAQSSPEFSWDTRNNVSLCNLQAFYRMFSPGIRSPVH